MKIAGITRIRNESEIIQNTLDHVAKLVDDIFVYDDCSTDNTVNICKAHSAVHTVLCGTSWASDPVGRKNAEGNLRTQILLEAQKYDYDWIYYFDADEYADFDGIDFTANAYKLRLFDFYITPEDVNKKYYERQWMGREYRDILMLFRNVPNTKFGERIPILSFASKTIVCAGYVKHYGKAISIEEWERTCDYYINHRGGDLLPEYTNKWIERKGKAVHTKSDFGNKLIKWEQRFEFEHIHKL